MALRPIRLLLLLLALFPARARAESGNDIALELGLAGEIVAGSWNPLRLTMRDQPEAVLVLELDQGSLRSGKEWVRYRAPLAGGSGISVFEDDVYIPAWRTFTWRVQTDERVLASGAFDRRDVDIRPLYLLASSDAGKWRDMFGADARVLEIASGRLPDRAAAYDGVAGLLLDGSQAPPRAAAVAAAAAAGVTTFLAQPMPASYDGTLLLAPTKKQRLGAGWIVRAPGSEMAGLRAGPPLDRDALVEALLTPGLTEVPDGKPLRFVLFGAAGYLLAAFLLVYFGRVPGLLTALAVASLAALMAWNFLRPESDVVVHNRTLSLSGGGLAYRLAVRTLFTYPARQDVLSVAGIPLTAKQYASGPGSVGLTLSRWSTETLAMKPALSTAELGWENGRLHNLSDAGFGDVFVMGYGPQGTLQAGDTLLPEPVEYADRDLPASYIALTPLLPSGSALARRGDLIAVALPGRPSPDDVSRVDAASEESRGALP